VRLAQKNLNQAIRSGQILFSTGFTDPAGKGISIFVLSAILGESPLPNWALIKEEEVEDQKLSSAK
jgi:hypothetical protein